MEQERPQRATGLSGSQVPTKESSTKRSAKLAGGSWGPRRLGDSRRFFCEETTLRDGVGTPNAARKRKGYRGKTPSRLDYYWPRKEPHTPKIGVGLTGRWVAA